MRYKLKTRKTKPFELYNNLEVGDIAELGFLLNIDDAPRKSIKKIVAEHLWVKIENIVYESNNIYRASVTEEPRFLKHLRMGDEVEFSPENVLTAKSKKPQKKIKSLVDFVYQGSKKEGAIYKQLIQDKDHAYAIDPGVLILRKKASIKDSQPIESLESDRQKELESWISRFESIDLDKFHVKIDSDFMKKSSEKIKTRSNTQASINAPPPLIRISDRTYLSFNLVGKLLVILKKMLVYLEFQDDFPMLYFINDQFEGFISLAKHTSDAIVVDIMEK